MGIRCSRENEYCINKQREGVFFLKIQVFVEDERKMKESMCSINCFPDISPGFYLFLFN